MTVVLVDADVGVAEVPFGMTGAFVGVAEVPSGATGAPVGVAAVLVTVLVTVTDVVVGVTDEVICPGAGSGELFAALSGNAPSAIMTMSAVTAGAATRRSPPKASHPPVRRDEGG